MKPYAWTIQQCHNALSRREISSVELTRAVLDRIAAVDDKVRAYLLVTPEVALAQAAAVDARRSAGEALSPLAGVPMAIKDNMCTFGTRTTCASRILHDFIPPYDATVVERLRAAGAVFVGKANMDEFAMGSSCENSGFFPTHNPWALDRVPGGSSGGSGAAVAAGEAIYALGSDTGGSVRLPASFCGMVGLKPTYGRVSRYGLVAYASSLDQIGPLTRDVTDCALVMNAIAGHDRRDSTSVDTPVPDYTAALGGDVRGLRVGVPAEYFGDAVEPGVRASIDGALRVLEGLGATVAETSLPHTRYAIASYYIIAPAEASANLARYDGMKYGLSVRGADIWDTYCRTREEGFGAEVKRRIMLGTYALSAGYYDAYYLQAQKTRTLIKQDFDRAFEKYDVLVTPVSPTVAFRLGEKTDDPLAMYLSDVCTVTVNQAGIPGLSVPCGFADGLPVGMQLLAPAFEEETLLRVARAFERASDFRRLAPLGDEGS
ncbi:MAG: Asp-tRNA(Asn)/Glu-tRNA(Gln) amidotransferase subunit GatA [Chloroflexi bacterium]|nr:Asp-tRNA(Asn)/Glu-tRNA(Gln) amidotransferase subunit GatA [Chloroflexota bacterium]